MLGTCPLWVKILFYCPQRSWGKVMFLQASMILSTDGVVCLSACWNTTPPQEQTHPPGADPPGADTPGSRPSTRSRHPPRADTPPEQTPPLEHTPPTTEHAGRYSQRVGSTHPNGMQSCTSMQFSVTKIAK